MDATGTSEAGAAGANWRPSSIVYGEAGVGLGGARLHSLMCFPALA